MLSHNPYVESPMPQAGALRAFEVSRGSATEPEPEPHHPAEGDDHFREVTETGGAAGEDNDEDGGDQAGGHEEDEAGGNHQDDRDQDFGLGHVDPFLLADTRRQRPFWCCPMSDLQQRGGPSPHRRWDAQIIAWSWHFRQ